MPPDSKLRRITSKVGPWLRRNAYLGLVAAALLVLTRTVEFTPPEQVRTSPTPEKPTPELVGDGFPEVEPAGAGALAAEAVQMRAVLRRYEQVELPPGGSLPDEQHLSDPLSQPVVTTVIGVEAEIRQTVRLGPDLDIDLAIVFTPRLVKLGDKDAPASIALDQAITVHSRRRDDGWGATQTIRRVHLDTRGVFYEVASTDDPLVFAVDDQLFHLDISLQRGG